MPQLSRGGRDGPPPPPPRPRHSGCLSVCLSVRPSVRLSQTVCSLVRQSVSLSVCLSVCLSLSLSLSYPSLSLSPIHLSLLSRSLLSFSFALRPTLALSLSYLIIIYNTIIAILNNALNLCFQNKSEDRISQYLDFGKRLLSFLQNLIKFLQSNLDPTSISNVGGKVNFLSETTQWSFTSLHQVCRPPDRVRSLN